MDAINHTYGSAVGAAELQNEQATKVTTGTGGSDAAQYETPIAKALLDFYQAHNAALMMTPSAIKARMKEDKSEKIAKAQSFASKPHSVTQKGNSFTIHKSAEDVEDDDDDIVVMGAFASSSSPFAFTSASASIIKKEKKKTQKKIKINKDAQSGKARTSVKIQSEANETQVQAMLRNKMVSMESRQKEDEVRRRVNAQDRLESKAAAKQEAEKRNKLLDLQIEKAEEEKAERARKRMRGSEDAGNIN